MSCAVKAFRMSGEIILQCIKKHKGLSTNQDILDHMDSTELAANLFRATQIEEKLRRENIQMKNPRPQVWPGVGIFI